MLGASAPLPAQKAPEKINDPPSILARLERAYPQLISIELPTQKVNPAHLTQCKSLWESIAVQSDPALRQRLALLYGHLLFASGQIQEAIPMWTEVWSDPAKCPSPKRAARAILQVASVHRLKPASLEKAAELEALAIQKTAHETSLAAEHVEARFAQVYTLYILGKIPEASKLFESAYPLALRLGRTPENEPLFQRALRFRDALRESDFFPPWEGAAAFGEAAVRKRTADLHFGIASFSQANALYAALEKDSRQNRDMRLEAWCALMQGLCLEALEKPQEALKHYELFRNKHRREASMAAYAFLRAGLLSHGALKDQAGAVRWFKAAMEVAPHSQEAEDAEYFVATLALWDKRWQEAQSRFEAFVRNHLQSGKNPYIKSEIFARIALQGKPVLSPPSTPDTNTPSTLKK